MKRLASKIPGPLLIFFVFASAWLAAIATVAILVLGIHLYCGD